MSMKIVRAAIVTMACALAFTASAQIVYTPLNPAGPNNAFPAQNAQGPTGIALQTNYPYPGQCLADKGNAPLFPLLTKVCAGGSFDATTSQRTAGGWAATGVIPFKELNPIVPNSVPPAGTLPTPKFVQNLLNPLDYTPDKATYSGADYYEIGLHESWGFQGIASAGLFPNPGTANPVPNGMQWTGLICNIPGGCSCPPDASATFKTQACRAGGKIPAGAPLFTPIWGVGQINMGGGPVTSVLGSPCGAGNLCTPSTWSSNSYFATWPSISIRANKGTPVVVKWVNEFPNNHVLCPHPEAADWPCAIDRTFMGVKARVDPAVLHAPGISPEEVNPYGSPQQPDNSWVTHLHGGEIPPQTDGFAEKWFGNAVTAPLYKNLFASPPFENPSFITLQRPAGNFDIYTYPMVQEEATIWFHDHTLGKTHHNVIAGPAGFFPVKEPLKHGLVNAGKCPAGDCSYTWLDPVTEPRGALGIPKYDLFMAVQDRSFNDDGSINFSNGLGQVIPPPPALLPVGYTSITPGVNPQVHPTWVPEYFGDHVLVNGVLWPKKAVEPGWYRLRIVDGSDSRCYDVGFSTILPAPNTNPKENVPFYVIANDQGYLQSPVLAAPVKRFTMCPGERYELLVNFNFANLPGRGTAPTSVYMTNQAPAPFPAGITPMALGSPYAEMNVIMRFDVDSANGPGIGTCTGAAVSNGAYSYPSGFSSSTAVPGACIPDPALYGFDPAFKDIRPPIPFPAGTIVRQVYLNERVDGVTLAPLGMQLNGVPFEYKVTETPKKGSREVWQFINLTVDAHPMHPHLVAHQIVAREKFSVGQYKALLCGSTTCQPGTAPGGEMQVVPDVTPLLLANVNPPIPVTAASIEGGRKDATQAPPGFVTTIVADWAPRWAPVATTAAAATAPGSPAAPACVPGNPLAPCAAASKFTYADVTTGPYVWHCHINSHEDSEMMRTSLVVK